MHFVSASGKTPEAHRVITTAVQPASQLVEIQSAPPAAVASGDAFRVTFAASVEGSLARDAKTATGGASLKDYAEKAGGGSTGERAATLGVTAKSLSSAVSGGQQSIVRSSQVATKAALNLALKPKTVVASKTNLDTASDAALTGGTAAEDSVELTTVNSDPLPKASTLANTPAPAKAAFAETAISSSVKGPAVPAVAIGPTAATVVAKSVGLAKSVGVAKQVGSGVEHGRNEDASVARSDIASGTAQPIAQSVASASIEPASITPNAASSGDSEARLEVSAVAQPAGAPVAQQADRAWLSTNAIVANHPANVAASGLAVTGKSGGPASAGLREIAAIQEDNPGFAKASQPSTHLDASGTTESKGNLAGNAGATVVAESEGGDAGDQGIALSHQAVDSRSSFAVPVKTASASGALLVPVGPDTGLTQQPVVAQPVTALATTVSAISDDLLKTGAIPGRSDVSTVSEAGYIGKQQPVGFSQPPIESALERPKTTSASLGTVSNQGSDFGSNIRSDFDSNLITNLDAINAAGSHAVDAATPQTGDGSAAQTFDSAHEVALVSTLPSGLQGQAAAGLPSGSKSAATIAEGKGGKTKPVTDAGSESSLETQPTVSQSSMGGSAGAAAGIALAAANGVVAASIGSGAGVPLAHAAAAETAAASSHAAGASAAPAGTAHALSGTADSALSESSVTASQIGESHRTLLATPTTLEVGVQSGTQGWLRIRAEVGGQGEVTTSLAAASSGGRELLHSQMPALNAFLRSEQIATNATVVDRVPATAGGVQGDAGTGPGSRDGSGGSNGSLAQGGGAQSDRSQRDGPQPSSVSGMVSSYDARSGMSDLSVASGRAGSSEESGRWLNVRV